jgi:hypothetical protein
MVEKETELVSEMGPEVVLALILVMELGMEGRFLKRFQFNSWV